MVSAFRCGILKDRLDPAMIDINLGFAFSVILLFIVGLFSSGLWMLNRGIGLRS
jgi:ABC-2 type transport system permease protein